MTENGCAVAEEDVDEALKDIERAVYLKRYLTEVRAVQNAAVYNCSGFRLRFDDLRLAAAVQVSGKDLLKYVHLVNCVSVLPETLHERARP
jgi:hypothetical protein